MLQIRNTLMRIRIPLFTLMRIRILLSAKWCEAANIGLQTIHRFILSLHTSTYRVGPPWLHFEPPQLPNFDFDADPDPDPVYHSHADAIPDPDPAFKMCGSGSATLQDLAKLCLLKAQLNFTESKEPAMHWRKRCDMGKYSHRQKACSP